LPGKTEMTQPTPPARGRSVVPFTRSLRGTALLALLCNLVLEATRLATAQNTPWEQKTPAYVFLFLLGTAVLWVLIGLVHAVVGRLWLTTVLSAGATAVVAVADHEKIRMQGEPLYPSDWAFAGNAGFLQEMLGGRLVFLLTLVLLLTAAVTVPVLRALGRQRAVQEPGTRPRPARMAQVTARLAVCCVCLLALGYLGEFNSPGNAARGAYELLGARWRAAGQRANYLTNGFVGGFLSNLRVPLPAPAGYGPAEMSRVVARYRRAAERINETRQPEGLSDVNVVMILSESFSDPRQLNGVHLEEDPIPFLRGLMSTTTSGDMLTQAIGGKTANMEFEALTGMSMSQFPPQLQVPYHVIVPDHPSFPSALQWVKRHGHRAVAIHPYTTGLYRRRDVYPVLGFDDFVDQERIREPHRIGHDAFISDASAFDEVRRQLEAVERPMLLHLVTMQNHTPYADRYADPAEATGPNGERLTDLGHYVRGLTHTDRALETLIGGLRRLEERTVVVFYGDHLPGGDVYPESVYDANTRRAMHQTPFFVWANFPGPEARQPTTSPIHFFDLVLERAGAPVPPYYALLHELRREVPAMDSGMLVGGDDRLLREGQLSDRAARLLRDYRLVQYDLAAGKGYSAQAMFAPAR
jgi:phosphoglycerol transferase MdoB-like AlkP superfamily enzyme